MKPLQRALSASGRALREGEARCSDAADRARYTQHLSAAALMFAELLGGGGRPALEKLVQDERKAFAASPLPGDEGEGVEKAFREFAAVVEEQP